MKTMLQSGRYAAAVVLSGLVLLIGVWQPGALRAVTPDPVVQGMIGQVQSSTLYTYVAQLSGKQAATIGGSSYTLATRSTTAVTAIEKATQFAYEHFQGLGLTVSYHTWQYSSGQRRNVVAEQPGSNPACLYLLVAHIDSTSPTPATLAPGADDNASGTAGVMMAADILSQYEFNCTLRYVLFSGEEQGLLGSEAYADAAAQRGDPILGAVNLDMIAYNSAGSAPTIEMDIRSGTAGNPDRVLSNMIRDVISAYGLSLTPVVYASDDDESDQYSFWAAGFASVLVIEDWDDHSPYYHKTTDQVDTLNMSYYSEYVKAITAAMAHLAQVKSVPVDMPYRLYLPMARR